MRMLASSDGVEIIANLKHPGTSFRSVLALVLLAIVAAVCFSLGMWQLQRAAERDALHDSIERGRLQAPVVLSASSRAAELTPWRAARSEEHTSELQSRENL